MDTAKFISQLNSLPTLGTDDYHELVVLAEKYPWFAAAHILQAKCLFNQNKYGFKQSLKKAAIYTGDREVLYDVMYNQNRGYAKKIEKPSKPEITDEPVKAVETVEPIYIKIQESSPQLVELPTSPDANKSDSEGIILPIERISSNENKEDEVALIQMVTNDDSDAETFEEPKDKSQPDETESAVETLFEMDKVDSTKPLASVQTEQNDGDNLSLDEEDFVKEKVVKAPSIQLDEEDDISVTLHKRKIKKTPLKDIPSILGKDKKEKDSLVEMPNTIQPIYDPEKELQKLIVQPKENEILETSPTQSNSEKHDFLSWLSNVAPETKTETNKQPKKLPMSEEAKKLLDNFIKNRPSVGKLRTLNTQESNRSETSETPVTEVVSESLAILFLKQELPEKAIEVYRKLQLQNPQKFSYFAALIEKVENDMTGTLRK